MNAIPSMFIDAVLADAAYADDLIDGLSGDNLKQALDARMTATLAAFISENFEVVSHIETEDNPIFGSGSGFDATVWRGRADTAYADKVYVSMQGTTGAQDFLTDVNLALPLGAARKQLVDMVNWWNQITTPTSDMASQIQQTPLLDLLGLNQFFIPAASVPGTGLLTSVSSVQVNGHSLGGHLASAFARLFGDREGGVVIDSVTTFNSAGFSPGSELVFGKLESAMGIGNTTFKSAKQTNAFAQNGINVTTNSFYFNQIGSRVPVFNEEGITIPNHSLYKLTDTLALGDVIVKLSPTLTIDQLNSFLSASSNAPQKSLENALDSLRRLIYGVDVISTAVGDVGNSALSRSDFHEKLDALRKTVDLMTADNANLRLHPISTASTSNLLEGATGALDATPDVALAYRYALKELNPFIITGDAVLYVPHNQNGALDIHDPETGAGTLTDAWLKVRAEMLHHKNLFYQKDGDITFRGARVETVQFIDRQFKNDITGLDLTLTTTGRQSGTVGISAKMIFGGDAADELTGSDLQLGDRLFGNGGDDTLTGNGGDDYLEGGTGVDILNGGDGNDTLWGMQDADMLDGGAGSDELDGGKGDDTYIYRLTDGKALDTITDVDGLGRIRVYTDADNFTDLVGGRKIGDDLWESEDGKFTYTLGDDGEGNFTLHVTHVDGGGVVVHGFNHGALGINLEDALRPPPPLPATTLEINGTWAPKPYIDPLTGNTFYKFDDLGNIERDPGVLNTTGFQEPDQKLDGSDGADLLVTGDFEESVYGNGGNDVILGSELRGSIFYGGAGDDRIEALGYSEHAADYTEFTRLGRTVKLGEDKLAGGAGNDLIYGESAETELSLYAPGTLPTGRPGDWSRGGSGNDSVYGGAGDDVLMGGIGEDKLVGGAGKDVLLGDDDFGLGTSGNYWRVIHPNFGDMTPGFGLFELGLFPVVNASQAFPDMVFDQTGDPDFVYYKNGGADDVIFGGAGDDIAIGQFGNDRLYGEGGNDILAGWEGDDLLIGGEGNDLIAGDFGRFEQPNQRLVSFPELAPAGVRNPVNSDGSVVNQVGNDYLEGGAGNDVLFGEGGNDVLIGGADNDVLYGDAAYLPEELHGADMLDGGAGDDQLSGHGGNDHLVGGEGADQLDGGAGDDLVEGDDGHDVLAGGEGSDVLDGGAGNDQLFGGAGDDTLRGGAGDDQLVGGEGDDVLIDEEGANILIAGNGNDILFGGSLADVVEGGDGNDWIDAGAGDDIIRGGAGDDTYSLNLGDGGDFIEDADGANRIEFGTDIAAGQISASWSGSTLNVGFGGSGDSFAIDARQFSIDTLDFADGTRWTQKTLINTAPYVTLSGSGAAESISGIFYARTELLGLAGNDVLNGAGCDDLLVGGDGNDVLNGWAGADRYLFTSGEIGFDTVADSGFSGIAWFDWYYRRLGIADWEIRAEHGGQYQVIAEGEGGLTPYYFDTLEIAQDVFPDAEAVLIEPLPDAPVVLRNDTAMLQTLEQAGVLAVDTVVFGSGITLADLDIQFTPETVLEGHPDNVFSGGGNLEVSWGNAGFALEVPDLQYGFTGSLNSYRLGAGVEYFEFADGTRYTLDELLAQAAFRYEFDDGRIYESGGNGDDFIVGAEGNDTLLGNGGDDILWGSDGNDVLTGGDGDDALAGGAGDDVLEGGPGDDAPNGGEGADRIVFGLGDGFDELDVDNADVIVFRGSLTPDDLIVSRVFGTDLLLQLRATGDRMMFTGWFEDPEFRPSGFEFESGAFLTADEVEQRLELSGFATEGDDLIGGSEGDDVIPGLGGADEIYGNGGTDIVRGGGGDDFLADDFGSGVLDGGAGDDSIEVWADAQFVVGGAGDDFVYAAATDSIIAFNPGDGADTIYAVAAFTLSIGGGITADDLALALDDESDDLILSIGADDSIRLSRQFEDDPQAWPQITLQLFGSAHLYDFNAVIAALHDSGDATLALGDVLPALEFESSETQGLGGALANEYRLNGSLDGLTTAQIRAVLNDGNFGTGLQSLEPVAGNHPPQVTGMIPDQSATEDQQFSQVIDLNVFFDQDAGDTLIYSATRADGGALPAWLLFDADSGLLSGLPSNADVGTVNLRISATDGDGESASTGFALDVLNVNDAPEATYSLVALTAIEDELFSFTLPRGLFADIDAGDVLAYGVLQADGSALPGWLQFDASTLTLTGMPENADVGTVMLRVTATDGAGAAADTDFSLGVVNVNDAPVVQAALNDLAAPAGQAFLIALPGQLFTDVDAGDMLTLTATMADGAPLPDWMSFDPVASTLAGLATGAASGAYDLRFTATDIAGAQAHAGFKLQVEAISAGVTLIGTGASEQLTGTEYDDVIDGRGGRDRLSGLDGNDLLIGGNGADVLLGGTGSDVLDGGRGADVLRGGAGADMYVFGRGSGHDVIEDQGAAGEIDAILLGAGISLQQLRFTVHGDDLTIRLGHGDDQLMIRDWRSRQSGIEELRFADGQVVNLRSAVRQSEWTDDHEPGHEGHHGQPESGHGPGRDHHRDTPRDQDHRFEDQLQARVDRWFSDQRDPVDGLLSALEEIRRGGQGVAASRSTVRQGWESVNQWLRSHDRGGLDDGQPADDGMVQSPSWFGPGRYATDLGLGHGVSGLERHAPQAFRGLDEGLRRLEHH